MRARGLDWWVLGRALAFLVVFIASAAFAAVVWPSDERATPRTNIESIWTSADHSVTKGADVELTPTEDGGTRIRVSASFASETADFRVTVRVSDVISESLLKSCRADAVPCDPICGQIAVGMFDDDPLTGCYNINGVTLYANRENYWPSTDTRDPSSEYVVSLDVPPTNGRGYPLALNPGYAAVSIPQASAEPVVHLKPTVGEYIAVKDDVAELSICLPQSMADFRWVYGQVPDRLSQDGDCLNAVWYDPESPTDVTRGIATAELPSQLNQDDRNSLYVGVALGVAAAAAIGMITELPWKRQRSRDSESDRVDAWIAGATWAMSSAAPPEPPRERPLVRWWRRIFPRR